MNVTYYPRQIYLSRTNLKERKASRIFRQTITVIAVLSLAFIATVVFYWCLNIGTGARYYL